MVKILNDITQGRTVSYTYIHLQLINELAFIHTLTNGLVQVVSIEELLT